MSNNQSNDGTDMEFRHMAELAFQPPTGAAAGESADQPARGSPMESGRSNPATENPVPGVGRQKMSSILLQMAMTVNCGETVDMTNGSHLYSVDLASAAWNKTLGDNDLFEAALEQVADLDRRKPFGPEVNARAIVLEAIDKLVRYKRMFHADDQRTVVSTHPTESGALQVLWRPDGEPPPQADIRDARCEWDITLPSTITEPEFLPDTSEFPARDSIADAVIMRAKRRPSLRDRIVLLAEATGTVKQLVAESKSFFGIDAPPGLGALYYACNRVTEILAQVPECRELRPLVEFFHATSRSYGIGPKDTSDMSRLFFNHWVFLDHAIGPDGENWCQALKQVCDFFEVRNEFTELVQVLGDSHLRVVRHLGVRRNAVARMRDLVTKEQFDVQVWLGSYYEGIKGQHWLVRLLPNPTSPKLPWLAATMPYILENRNGPTGPAWERYFRHHLQGTRGESRRRAYLRHMKEGTHPRYWADYINGHFVARDGFIATLDGVPGGFEAQPEELFELT